MEDGGYEMEPEVESEEEKAVETKVTEKAPEPQAPEKPKATQKEVDKPESKAEENKVTPETAAPKKPSGESELKPGDKVEFDLSKKKKNDDKGDGKDQLNLF